MASQELADSLASFGVVPNKTHSVVAKESLTCSRDFWRGVLDGDGYINVNGSFELAGMSDDFLNQFRHYLHSTYGSAPSITKNGQGCHRVGSKRQQLLLDLYRPGDVALDRKMEIVDQIRRSTNQSI